MSNPSSPKNPAISPATRNVLEQLPDHVPHLHHVVVGGPETYQPYETPPIPARISEDVVTASEQIMARVNASSGREQPDLGPYERTEKIGRIKGFLGKITNAAGAPEALEKRAKKLEIEAQAEEALAQYVREIAAGKKTAFILPEGAPARYRGKAKKLRRQMYETGKKQQQKQEQIDWTHDSTGSGRFRYNGGLQITGEMGDVLFEAKTIPEDDLILAKLAKLSDENIKLLQRTSRERKIVPQDELKETSDKMQRLARLSEEDEKLLGILKTEQSVVAPDKIEEIFNKLNQVDQLSEGDEKLLEVLCDQNATLPIEKINKAYDKLKKIDRLSEEDERTIAALRAQASSIPAYKLEALFDKLKPVGLLTDTDKTNMDVLRAEQEYFPEPQRQALIKELDVMIKNVPLNVLDHRNAFNAGKNPSGPSSPLHYWKVKRAQLNWDRSGSIQKPAEQLTVDEYREKEQEIGPRPIMDIYSPSLAMQRIDRISDPAQRAHEIAMLDKIQRLRDGTVADYAERLAMARGDKQHERAANARAKAAKARRAAQRLERWDEVGQDLTSQRRRHRIDSAFEDTQAVDDFVVRLAQRASRKASEDSSTGVALRAARDLTFARLPLPKDSWLEGRARKEIKKLQDSEVLAKSRRGETLTDKEQEKLRINRRERRQAQARLNAVLKRKAKKSAREKVTSRKLEREKQATRARKVVKTVRRTVHGVNVEATKEPNEFRDSLLTSPRRGYEPQTRRIVSRILTDPSLANLPFLASRSKKERRQRIAHLKRQAENQQNQDLLR